MMEIRFEFIPEESGLYEHWIAAIDDIPGMVVSGDTKQQAFNEPMTSIRIKLAHDNQLNYE